MTVTEHNRLLYGELMTEDESICAEHGNRLGHHDWGFGCATCERERRLQEREECAFDEEQTMAFADGKAVCKAVVGMGFVAFSCQMPWWS